MTAARIGLAGAGRMGRGLAVVFAYAGHPVTVVDLKERSDRQAFLETARSEVEQIFGTLVACGMLEPPDVARLAGRVSYSADAAALSDAEIVFEGVPETREAKIAAFEVISRHAPSTAIVASTTSTMLSDELQAMVSRPERFLNAHWLNPAYLMPLVELSPGARTDPAVTARLRDLLERIGKIPVVCKASPGFIVPRIQALAMNEAARLAEEGVATPEDIDRATRYGLGLRFAVLGVLEFIDWGGGDILYHASRYMEAATGEQRFRAPEIIERNMAENRVGMRTKSGFMNYEGKDLDAYRQERLADFVALLRHLSLVRPPV